MQATTVKLRGLHVKDPRRTARLAFNALLTAACMFTLVAAPMCRAAVDSWQSSSVSENKQLLKQTRELRQLAEKLSMDQTRYDDLRYSFAESLVTDTVGGDQLASGEAQYNAGKAQHRRSVHRPDGAPCEGGLGGSCLIGDCKLSKGAQIMGVDRA